MCTLCCYTFYPDKDESVQLSLYSIIFHSFFFCRRRCPSILCSICAWEVNRTCFFSHQTNMWSAPSCSILYFCQTKWVFFKKSNNFLDRRHQNAELKNSGLNVDICMQSAYFMSPKPPKSPGSTSTPSSPTGLVFVTFCRECLDPSESVTPYRSQPPPFTNPDCQEKSDDYKTVSCFYCFSFFRSVGLISAPARSSNSS